jgi:eukaryotic-like serine/threonine-protein kinase
VALSKGTRLGPYEILSPLGAGGMGEVYRARDTRLERTVAIKVLPERFTTDLESRQRFEREARAISQLSHPNICALYDVGSQEGTEYLVMELLEGEMLSERLVRGRLPLEQLVVIGTQICSALEAAHQKGIVHRDLKPGNIMLTKAGVKLLDFGLAKAIAPTLQAAELTKAPTAAAGPVTQSGIVVGTLHYMSPEQLEGKQADERTDLFALGTVLYEMATGKKAFSGTSQASLISAILTSEPPPVSSLQPMSPPALDQLVRTCLAKDPAERWQSAHDVRLQLKALAEGALAARPTETAPSRARATWLPWLVAGVALTIAAAATLRMGSPPGQLPRSIRFFVAPPPNGAFSYSLTGAFLAVSPDSSQLAYIASEPESDRKIFLRPLSSLEARPIPGTERARSLFWSPDGRSIAFFDETRLRRVELSEGASVSICAVPPGVGFAGTWGQGGDILFASVQGEAIYRVSSAGGAPAVLLRPDQSRGEAGVNWPWFLSDGKRFLYLLRDVKRQASLMLAKPGKPSTLVMPVASEVQYAEPGYLVFAREGALLGQRFNQRSGRTSGEPFSIAGRVRYFLTTFAASFALSPTGTLAFQSQGDLKRLVWFDRTGQRLGTVGLPGLYNNVRISPDARRAFVDRAREATGTFDVWSIDLDRGTETPITSEPNSEFSAVLLPGGKSIAYSSSSGGLPGLLRRDLATGRDEELLPDAKFQLAQDVSPDGKSLVYTEQGEGGVFNIWMLPLTGGGKPIALLQSAFNKREVRLSPDGRFLAMISSESGRPEVYVTPFPGPGERVRVSTGGAQHLRWSRDGRELFYISSDQRLISVPVRTSPTLELGAATPLFSLPRGSTGPGAFENGTSSGFDVSPDGKRFLVVLREVVGDELPVSVVVNWTAEIEK